MKTVLIDGDMLAYRNAAALQGGLEIDWGEGVTSKTDEAWKGHARMDKFIERMQDNLFADRAIVCLSSIHSFRRDLDTGYKSNRNEKARPTLLPNFADYLRRKGAVTYDRLEADDVMGILATNPKDTGEYVICTIDKDLKQIPGWYYNPYPPGKLKPVSMAISMEEADDFFFYQTLVGDVIDGYKGCHGIGPKKALNLIKEVRDSHPAKPLAALWKAVVAVYVAKGMSEQDALNNARMARILRHEDYDPKQGVKLWTPPS